MGIPSSEDEETKVTDEEKDEEADSDGENLAPIFRTVTATVKPGSSGMPPAPRVSQNKKPPGVPMEVDSVTESESDGNNRATSRLPTTLSSKSKTAGQYPFAQSRIPFDAIYLEESVTESETEPESDPDQAAPRGSPNPPKHGRSCLFLLLLLFSIIQEQ